ncbi:ZIP family metal transporter [Patescibacteria group bacterium]|nr:ZIP family metal transporter [Patescibacteria group bacterium]
MTVLIIAFAASAATFIGGSFALRFRDKLHLILGFSAGAVAGVALFDLLPEAISLGSQYHSAETVALGIAAGLFGYLILDRLILLHSHEEDEAASTPRGFLGALTLSTHSFLDGIAIGVGFQATTAIGIIVAAAVLTHDFSDGINTVNLVLRNGGTWKAALRWLAVDAAAPFLGAAATLFFHISESAIGLVLAVFVGSFLYLAASDLIPESHHRHPRALTTVMTLFGALVIYIVVHVV